MRSIFMVSWNREREEAFSALICCLGLASFGLGLSNSKISVHGGSSLSGPTTNFLKSAQPRVFKLLDPSPGMAKQVKSLVPGITVVCRIYLNSQPETGDPVAAAHTWWSQVSNNVLSNPECDYVEGYNEPGVGTIQQVQWLAQFEVARINLLSALGIKSSTGNFGTGNPDITNPTLVKAYLPAIQAVVNASGILGLHEYTSPYMWSCFDNSTGQGWLTGRYRKLYSEILQPAGLTPKLVISEGGIDNVGGMCGGPSLGGWLKLCPTWAQAGWSDCNQSYVQQLAWYDSILRQDDFVIGTTLFQVDLSGWDPYDVTPAFPDLIAYMTSQ